MLIPVRCFTCNRVIGHLWNHYKELITEKSPGEALDELGLTSEKYCCRRMLLGHIDIIDRILQYSNNPGEPVSMNLSS